jgi:hypothetical protein
MQQQNSTWPPDPSLYNKYNARFLSLWDRFWMKVDASGDCWVWMGSIHPKGYGQFQLGGETVKAVHVAWQLLVGPCPVGLVPDHLCRKRSCVNVGNHIEWVTIGENSRRGYSIQALNGRKITCVRGHPLHGENVRPYTYRGQRMRICRTCDGWKGLNNANN